jgi:hypothetical protein
LNLFRRATYLTEEVRCTPFFTVMVSPAINRLFRAAESHRIRLPEATRPANLE